MEVGDKICRGMGDVSQLIQGYELVIPEDAVPAGVAVSDRCHFNPLMLGLLLQPIGLPFDLVISSLG